MYKRNPFLTIVLLLWTTVALLGIGACRADGQVHSEVVCIGAIYTLSGRLASMGQALKQAMELAAEIINSEYKLDLLLAQLAGVSGLDGARVEVMFADHAGDPEQGSTEAQRLIVTEGVVALLGTYNSSNVTAGHSQRALAVALLGTLLAAVVKRQITRPIVRPPPPPHEVLPPEPEAKPPGIIAIGFKPTGLTIQRRLMLGLAIVACLLLLGSGVSIWQLSRLSQAVAALEEETDRISAALQLRLTSSEIASDVERVAEERDTAGLMSTVVAAESNLEESAAAFRSAIGEPGVGDPIRALLVSIESTLSRFQDTNELLMEQAQAEDWEEVQHHIEETLPHYHSFLGRVTDRVIVEAKSRQATAAAQVISARRAAALYLLVSTTLALIVTAATVWTTARSITGPVERLAEGVARLAAGHLDERVPVARRDELGRLAMALNEMADHLQTSYSKLEQRVAERTREYEEAIMHTQQAHAQLYETHDRLEVTTRQAQRRATQLETAAEVSRAATSMLNPDELVRQAVDLIHDRFDLYYVGLFLLDESGRWAVLWAGTGEPGRQMLKAGHKLEVGGQSMVGWCTANARARIALDIGEETVGFDSPLLPKTRSEMALPLISRGRVIGALDAQSVEASAFSDEDIAVLQTMADQIAVAIDNARLFTEAQARLETVQAVHRSYLRESWDEFLPTRETTGYECVQPDVTFLSDAVLPEAQQGMAQQRTAVLSGSGDGKEEPALAQSALVTPITLRGQVIGVLGLQEAEETRQWTADEIALVEAIADQMALAIENARLFEEARIRAEELAVLNELGQALTTHLNVEEVLDEAYRGASRLLDTTNFYIGLYDPERHEINFAFDVTESAQDAEITVLPADQGLAGYIIRNRTSVLLEENVREGQEALGIEMVGEEPQSWLGVPLIVGDRVLGVMAAQSFTTPHTYDEHDRDLLTAIASQVAIALHNARLFKAAQARARRERLIREITGKVQGSIDLDAILQTTVQELGKALGASHAVVRLGTETGLSLPDQVEKQTMGTHQNDRRHAPGVSAEQKEV